MKRTLRPGTVKAGYPEREVDLFLRVEWDGKRLSICGVEGPKRDGDAYGSCGQCVESLGAIQTFAPGWNADKVAKLKAVWDEWHLNDMTPGCEHQTAANWGRDSVEVVTYELNMDAWKLKKEAESEAMNAAREGRTAQLTELGRFLIGPDWFKSRFTPPDADSFLSGMYEVKKRETKLTNWVYPHEHQRGVLTKPCPECGYKYGSAWLTREVPQDVISFLESLPESDKVPAWV